VDEGRIGADRPAVLWHTGGAVTLFTNTESFSHMVPLSARAEVGR
jgi:hypothetical protein